MPVSVRPARSAAPDAPRNAERVVLVVLARIGERRCVRVHSRKQLQRHRGELCPQQRVHVGKAPRRRAKQLRHLAAQNIEKCVVVVVHESTAVFFVEQNRTEQKDKPAAGALAARRLAHRPAAVAVDAPRAGSLRACASAQPRAASLRPRDTCL